MPKTSSDALKRCAKAVGAVYSTGQKANDAQKLDIKKGREVLREIMTDLLKEEPVYMKYIELTLKAVHPKNDYCPDMVLRDLADICITLSRLENDKGRSDDGKLVDAMGFCQGLADDLDQEA